MFVAGAFHEHTSCLISVAISAYFFTRILSEGKIRVRINFMFVSIAVICLFYGLTCFWAIDSGMAFIGFVKYLPILLYLLLLYQEERESQVLTILPYVAVGMVVISAVGAQIPMLKAFFTVAGRFAGFFQYPNTFAIFLLLCELLILQKAELRLWDYISVAVLIGGILYTGSRTVFLLFIASNFVMILLIANKKAKAVMLLVLLFSIVAILLLMLLLRDNAIVSRYLNMDFGASTFVGRILYVIDALPLVLKYPFGMGYMGYYYMQNSIQSGVYYVTFVHNDFLQLFLDIGWIPALLFLGMIGSFFFKKKVSLTRKLIVATFCVHTFFDFDLQYMAMFFLLLLLMYTEDGKEMVYKVTGWKRAVPLLVLAVSTYMGVALILAHYKQMDASNAMYPYNTRNNLNRMEEAELAEANQIADHILKQNEACYGPYSVKAQYAYSQGNFAETIKNKHEAFERNPFRYTEYKEYCVMLLNGISIFSRQGDVASVRACNQEILATYERLESNKTRLSKLGKRIEEQPILEFSEDIMQYIQKIEKGEK